jgi:hypothetical protein
MNSPFPAATTTKEEQRLSKALIISFPITNDRRVSDVFVPLCSATYEIVANAVLRECAFLVQQNQFVLRETYGIDNVNCFAITLGFARESHTFFYQLRYRVCQVIKCGHDVPPIPAISSSRLDHTRLGPRIWGSRLQPIPQKPE